MILTCFGLAFLMLPVVALIMILPSMGWMDPDWENLPRRWENNGKSVFHFCYGALFLLGVYLLPMISLVLDNLTNDYYETTAMIQYMLLFSEYILGALIAVLLLFKSYGQVLRYLLAMQIGLVGFNNFYDLDGLMSARSGKFLGLFSFLLFAVAELLFYLGVFWIINIVRHNGIGQDPLKSKNNAVLFLRLLPSVFLLRPLFNPQMETLEYVQWGLELVAYFLVLNWVAMPFRYPAAPHIRLAERYIENKVKFLPFVKFTAVAIAILLAFSSLVGGILCIDFGKKPDDWVLCETCSGEGKIVDGFGHKTKCPICLGEGELPPIGVE